MRISHSVIALLAVSVSAEPIPRAAKLPTVDLGYAVYEGTFDNSSRINSFKGYS